MFNSSNNRSRDGVVPPAVPPVASGGGKRGSFSVLGTDVVITGNVAATADIHIDGRVDGDVSCGNLIQGAESHINGSVVAESARLAGTIEGSVSIRQLTIERSARISGDVEYEALSIENGASIDGRLKHLSAGAPGRIAANGRASVAPQAVASPDIGGVPQDAHPTERTADPVT